MLLTIMLLFCWDLCSLAEPNLHHMSSFVDLSRKPQKWFVNTTLPVAQADWTALLWTCLPHLEDEKQCVIEASHPCYVTSHVPGSPVNPVLTGRNPWWTPDSLHNRELTWHPLWGEITKTHCGFPCTLLHWLVHWLSSLTTPRRSDPLIFNSVSNLNMCSE